MKLEILRLSLRLRHPWRIARTLDKQHEAEHHTQENLVVRLEDESGTRGLGETAPTFRYGDNCQSVERVLRGIDPARLSFSEVTASLEYLDEQLGSQPAARCALDLALHDGAARKAGQPVHAYLGVGFREGAHQTSMSIGIDDPDVVADRAREAAAFPILKLKLGGPSDRENLAALRSVAPAKLVRVDANEAWCTREDALKNLEWLAADSHIEFVEQPMPVGSSPDDLVWLKSRSPLPLIADESYHLARDLDACEPAFHGVNVKLVKAGGLQPALNALRAARRAGLKTMLGCMVESSIGITAAAHLAELTDYLDLDGSQLIAEDPYEGVSIRDGLLSMVEVPEAHGLGVRSRARSHHAAR